MGGEGGCAQVKVARNQMHMAFRSGKGRVSESSIVIAFNACAGDEAATHVGLHTR